MQHLIFGCGGNSKAALQNIRCVSQLEKLLLERVRDSGAQGEVQQEPDGSFAQMGCADIGRDDDAMGCAHIGRDMHRPADADGTEIKTKRPSRKSARNHQLVATLRPIDRVYTILVPFPRRPGSEALLVALLVVLVVNVRCLYQPDQKAKKMGRQVVWVDKDDLPWLVEFASEELCVSQGKVWEDVPPPPEAPAEATLTWSPGPRDWTVAWTSGDPPLLYHVTQKVPQWAYKGGTTTAPASRTSMNAIEFMLAKEKAKLSVVEQAKQRGCDVRHFLPGAITLID